MQRWIQDYRFGPAGIGRLRECLTGPRAAGCSLIHVSGEKSGLNRSFTLIRVPSLSVKPLGPIDPV